MNMSCHKWKCHTTCHVINENVIHKWKCHTTRTDHVYEEEIDKSEARVIVWQSQGSNTPMIDYFSCIPFTSERDFLSYMHFSCLRPPYYDNTVTLSAITYIDVTLNDSIRDVLHNHRTSNTWEFAIFIAHCDLLDFYVFAMMHRLNGGH